MNLMRIIKRIGLYLVILFLLLIIVFLKLNIKSSFEPAFLLPVLNTLFIGVMPIIVTFYAAKTYLQTNSKSALFMGLGMLIFGLGSIFAGWLRYIPNGANVNVTIFNLCAMFGAAFHLAAAMWGRKTDKINSSWRLKKFVLILSLLGVGIFIGLLIMAVLWKIMPPFINENGFTLLRQIVLVSAIVFYFSASMVLVKNYLGYRADYIYLYFISLFLIVVGLFGASVQPAVGSPVGWIARTAQYCSGFFALFSMRSASYEAKGKNTSVSNMLAYIFADGETSFRALVETSNDAIVSVDQDFRVLYLNMAAEKMFGVSKEQVEYTSFLDRYIEGGSKALLLNDFRTFVAAGTIDHISKTVEIEAKDSENRVFPAELSTSMRVLPIGYVITYIIRDITSRKVAEEELIVLKDHLAGEVEALNTLHKLNSNFIVRDKLEIIYQEILKAAVTMTTANKGCIQLYDEETKMLNIILGHGLSNRFLQYFACIDLETDTCGLASKEKRRIVVEDITECPIFSGKPGLQYLREENILCEQSTPLISSSGKFVGVINTYYPEQKQFSEREIRMLDMLARLAADIIERTRVEFALQESERRAIALVEELNKADRNKTQFLNSLSHELRNPLASMMMSLSLLKIAAPDSEQALQARETFERQTIQLSRLVDDLLEVTRITQNKVKLKKDLVELNHLVSKTVKDYKQMFAEKRVSLEIKSPLKPIHLQADATRLTQVLGNLLHNALKFTDGGGQTQVIISQEDNSKQAAIQVKDNGLGIKPELLEDLFQPFTQADTSLEHSSGGLGLGLAIVKGMVELHGGNVMASSEGLGKGAEFTIRLPLNIDDKTNQVKELQKDKKISCKRRILVIDDIPDVAEILCSLLLYLGHEVTTAANGVKGISKAKEFKPDVILCDIGLPGMNGYEVARNIRRDYKMKDIILIALSGYAQPEDLERSKEAGFNCHLAKPVDLDKLEQILAEDIIIDAPQNIGA